MSKKGYEDIYSTAGDFDFDFSPHLLVSAGADDLTEDVSEAKKEVEEKAALPESKDVAKTPPLSVHQETSPKADAAAIKKDTKKAKQAKRSVSTKKQNPQKDVAETVEENKTETVEENKAISSFATIRDLLALSDEQKIAFFPELMMLGNNIPRDLWFDLLTCVQLSEDVKNVRRAVHLAIRTFVDKERKKIDADLFQSVRTQTLDRSLMKVYKKAKSAK